MPAIIIQQSLLRFTSPAKAGLWYNPHMTREQCFAKNKRLRIVVKVGSSLITTKTGRTNRPWMRKLVAKLVDLREAGHSPILVSSGAIAAGIEKLGLTSRPEEIATLQSAAAVGQGILVRRYADMFSKLDVVIGQVLLTQFDTTHRQQYLNARAALGKMVEMGVVPIVNENDTTAVDEIRFGDNDTLAALVAVLVSADALVLLSDIDGLCTSDPRSGRQVECISTVEEITPQIEALVSGSRGKFGSGGMATKLAAGRIAGAGGTAMIIANGTDPAILGEIVAGGEIGTFFKPAKKKLSARKVWIAFARAPMGTVTVDQGAKNALVRKGGSLLAAGVTGATGEFAVGDAVDIADDTGATFAKGMVNYSQPEITAIVRKLGERQVVAGDFDEVVHRDCLVIL